MTELTDAGREARREYMREWGRNHKDYKRDYMRKWRKKHKESVHENQNNYWNKVGAQMEAEEAKRKEQEQDENNVISR